MKRQLTNRIDLWKPLYELPSSRWEMITYVLVYSSILVIGLPQLYNWNAKIGNKSAFTIQGLIAEGLTHLKDHIVPLLLFTLISRTVRMLYRGDNLVTQNLIHTVLGMVAIGVTHGTGHLLWLLPYFFIWQYLVSRRSKFGIWALALITFLSIDARVCRVLNVPFWPYYLTHLSFVWVRNSEFFLIMAYFQCRAIIIGVDLCNSFTKPRVSLQDGYSPTVKLTFAWRYFFYPVTFFSGSFIDLETFCKYCRKPLSISKAQALRLLQQFITLMTMWILFELSTKSVEPKSILSHKKTPPHLAFCALVTALLQFYAMNYVFFGWSHFIARLDGFQVAEPPKCFFSIYRSAEVWRDFDRGLGFFLRQYIYEELDDKVITRPWPRRMFNSGCCFLYMILFHGAVENNVIWAVVNYCARMFEIVTELACLRGELGNWMVKKMEGHWLRRACTFLVSQYWMLFSINALHFMGYFSKQNWNTPRTTSDWSITEMYIFFSIMYYIHVSVAIWLKESPSSLEKHVQKETVTKNAKKYKMK